MNLPMSTRILTFLWLCGVLSLAITSPRDRTIALLLLGFTVGIVLLDYVARKTPEAPWVYWLYGWRRGPRTDVAHMSRRDLCRSGLQFLLWAAISFGVLAGIGWFGFKGERDLTNVFMVLLFVSTIVFLMCLGGGLYLLVRAALDTQGDSRRG